MEAVTLADAIRTLNDINAADPAVLPALLNFRVPCNQALADHPTVQVGATDHGYVVGLLGILNGIFGIREDGCGYLYANVDDEGLRITHFGVLAAPQAGEEEG